MNKTLQNLSLPLLYEIIEYYPDILATLESTCATLSTRLPRDPDYIRTMLESLLGGSFRQLDYEQWKQEIYSKWFSKLYYFETIERFIFLDKAAWCPYKTGLIYSGGEVATGKNTNSNGVRESKYIRASGSITELWPMRFNRKEHFLVNHESIVYCFGDQEQPIEFYKSRSWDFGPKIKPEKSCLGQSGFSQGSSIFFTAIASAIGRAVQKRIEIMEYNIPSNEFISHGILGHRQNLSFRDTTSFWFGSSHDMFILVQQQLYNTDTYTQDEEKWQHNVPTFNLDINLVCYDGDGYVMHAFGDSMLVYKITRYENSMVAFYS